MDSYNNGFDDPSTASLENIFDVNKLDWNTNDNFDLEIDIDHNRNHLLRSIAMNGIFGSSDTFKAEDGHCYVNTNEKMILEEIFSRNIKVGASLDLLASVDDPQPIFESEVIEFKEIKRSEDLMHTIIAYFGRYLCAFRNHRGGILLLGVSDNDKIISGVQLTSEVID